MKMGIVKGLSLALGLTMTSVASAAQMLWVGDEHGNLGAVDTASGDVQIVGNMGTAMTDIAFDNHGNLYGISFDSLFRIDATTAQATLVGQHDLGTGAKNSLVFGADGTLYAAGDALYSLDVSTGASSLLGNGGMGYASSGDLAFVDGELYLSAAGVSDNLMRLDVATGAATLIGGLGYSTVYGLATDLENNLFGLSGTSVLSVDTISGAASFILDYAGQGLGAAWGSAFYDKPSVVPEPSVLLMMSAGLLGLGFTRARKTKHI